MIANTLLAFVVSCVVIRWCAPQVLRALAKTIQTAVVLCAAVLIWPEYRISTSRRREHRVPSRLAYDYSAAVGWIAMLAYRFVGYVLNGVANGLRGISVGMVAVLGVAVTVGFLLV
ncbi:hypothetical protein KIPE111705_04335 [Kibdelosporangium persicum]|uniref:Uncharacterized protein n=1 Tax=Kibdelosporangium persicum TaxID=2698649 RepID=A0ABX2F597_9PSEU|nr:hypothetical protein [Kibdelosporangium persicum]NRN66514.1 hypothetical protein [Kibdelosporangium persicum]